MNSITIYMLIILEFKTLLQILSVPCSQLFDNSSWLFHWTFKIKMNQNNFHLLFLSLWSTQSPEFCLIKWYRIQPVSHVKVFSLFIINLKNCLKWSESRSVVSSSLWPHGLYSPWNSLGQNTGVGNCSLIQGIFPTERLNPGLLNCRWILYQLSHQGSPRILEWGRGILGSPRILDGVAYPFSSRSSWPSNQTRVSYTRGGFFTSWATREKII